MSEKLSGEEFAKSTESLDPNLQEWLEQADQFAREINMSLGMKTVRNWTDAKKEALALSQVEFDEEKQLKEKGVAHFTKEDQKKLRDVGKKLLEMIPEKH